MSNLGWYQEMTRIAKKVGGPKNLLILTLGMGYLIIRSGEAIVKKVYKEVNKSRKHTSNKKLLSVTSDGKFGKDLEMNIGDKYRIIESDGESAVIEKVGDSNNPYVVSFDFLSSISELQRNDL